MSDQWHPAGVTGRGRRPRILRRWSDSDTAEQAQALVRAEHLLAATVDPTLRAVLEHHGPVTELEAGSLVCRGCDIEDDTQDEPPVWPCSTWLLIENLLQRLISTRSRVHAEQANPTNAR